jgi:tetratricopeptide (TPR) repeat protein
MKAGLMQVFFWPTLKAEFQHATIEHDAFTSIRLGDLLLEAARTLLPVETVQTEVLPSTAFQRTSQFELVLSSLDLKPEESFAAYRVEGAETTLTTLQLLTGLPDEKIARFMYALEKMGAIQFRSAEDRRPARRMEPPQPQQPVREAQPKARIEEAPRPPAVEETPTGRHIEAESVRMELQKSEKRGEAEHHIKVADQFFRVAQEKFAELDYWKVTELCKQAIRHNPADPRYYHLMAKAYAHHPRFAKDAEQCFYKAIEVDPWNPDFHTDLARFYLQQGLPTRAVNQCEKALKIAPENADARGLLSEINARK